jgi:hypothetical protein
VTSSSNYCGLPLPMYRSMLLGDVNDFLDEEGRPIGEIRASASVRTPVHTEYGVCKYPGRRGRTGLRMNLSALKQATRNWARVLGTIEYMRAAYLERRPCTDLTLLDFARLAAAGLLLPAYILFREPNAIADGRVPVFIAATHKMLAGVFSASKNMLLCQVAMGKAYDQVLADPTALFNFSEISGMLVGKTGIEVCAGAPNMIEEVLNLLAYGKWKNEPDHNLIRELLPDTDSFFSYADAMGDMMFWVLAFALRERELVETLSAQLESERLCAPPSSRNGWFAHELAKLSDFKIVGFGAQVLPFQALEPEAAEAIVHGVIPLFRDLREDEKKGALFERETGDDGSAEAARLLAWLLEAERCREWTPGGLKRLSGAVTRCLHAERDGLRLFKRLQDSIHRALGRMLPLRKTEVPLAALFGALASERFEEVLGIEIEISPNECRLMDGARHLCLQ